MNALPLFSDKELGLTDETLGELLLEKYVAAIVEKNGFDPELIHPTDFRAIVDAIESSYDVEDARLAGLEKALKKAALGEFGPAGRLLRNFVQAGFKDAAVAD